MHASGEVSGASWSSHRDFGRIAAHLVVWIISAILPAIFVPQYTAVDPCTLFLATIGNLLVVGWMVSGFTGYWLLKRRVRFALECEIDKKSQGK